MKLGPVLGRAPHAERRMGRPGVVISHPLPELQEHRLGIPRIRTGDVIALQGLHERLGHSVALRAIGRGCDRHEAQLVRIEYARHRCVLRTVIAEPLHRMRCFERGLPESLPKEHAPSMFGCLPLRENAAHPRRPAPRDRGSRLRSPRTPPRRSNTESGICPSRIADSPLVRLQAVDHQRCCEIAASQPRISALAASSSMLEVMCSAASLFSLRFALRCLRLIVASSSESQGAPSGAAWWTA